MFFRILHNEISIPSHHLPIPITSCTRGHSQRFRQFSAHLSVYLNSFFPATTRIWNNLLVSAIEARNIDDFKQRIVEYFCISYRLMCCTDIYVFCVSVLIYSQMEVYTVLIINK